MNLFDDDLWKSDEEKELDKVLEKSALDLSLQLSSHSVSQRGESLGHKTDNLPKYSFSSIEELEAAPKRPMQTLFYEAPSFPAVETLGIKEIKQKVRYILGVFKEHNIQIIVYGNVPDKELYHHLTQKVIPYTMTYPPHSGAFCHIIDGCCGECGTCFQNTYCKLQSELFSGNN